MIKRKLGRLPLIIPILTLIFGVVPVLPASAISTNYYLNNPNVNLNGSDDGSVDISFNTVTGDNFTSIEADWSLSETNDTDGYFTLTNLTPASSSINPTENDPATGHIVWSDFSNFIEAGANSAIWTASYDVAANTPSGTYTISFTLDDISSESTSGDSDTEAQGTYTSTVTVQNANDDTRTPIIPVIEGVKDSYAYTGSQITPDFVAYADSEKTTPLALGTDYTVAYGENTNLGTGTITLSEVATSDYSFSDYSANFAIVPYELTAANVSVPSSITYTGSALTPAVTVTANNTVLTEGTDYTVNYSGQDGNIGDNVTIVVNGQGNYTGVVDNLNVAITAKPTQTLTFAEPTVTKTYGDASFTNPATLSVGDGVLSYSSSDTSVATVDLGTGDVTILGAGQTTITATATETDTYSETTATYTLTVSKVALTEANISLSQNIYHYDGTAKEPTVTVTYGERTIPTEDYSVSYANNTEIGTATVTVTPTNPNYIATPISVDFTITEKEVLDISGIPSGQSTYYTGSPVVIQGELVVGENTDGITPEDLTTTWYDSANNVIEQPTNVGDYSVTYSYTGENYEGSLTVTFSIVKAPSGSPEEFTAGLRGIQGEELSTVALTSPGLSWADASTVIQKGENIYPANYIRNNDSENYLSSLTLIPIYGRAHISVTTSVDGDGGTISGSINDIIEDDTTTITFTPAEGYELDQVLVDGQPVTVTNNSYVLTAGSEDMTVVASFKHIQYTITITGNNFDTNTDSTITIDYNGDKDITITPKHGYKLVSVLVNDVEKINDLSSEGVLSLSGITENTTIVITTEKITYDVFEGAGQVYSITRGGTATFRINADYSLFENGGAVYVDGNLLTTDDYTSYSGSTVIVLSNAYLNTLANGTHTLQVVFKDGGTATTTFAITDQTEASESATASTSTNNPFTHDNIYISFILLGASFIALLGSVAYIYRKNSK